MGVVLEDLNLRQDTQVYELSAHGALFKYLRRKFKNLTFSEYFDNVAPGTTHKGVLCQNVEKLTFQSGAFDLITSTEVFEHVVNDTKGFAEVWRVLKPGGQFVFTVPLSMKPVTIERARIENGQLIHLVDSPTFGGDHLRSAGILDFRNYGMDIADRLQDAGFSSVEIRGISRPTISIPMKHVVIAKKY